MTKILLLKENYLLLAKQIQEENKNLQATTINTSRERVSSDEASVASTETLLNTALKQAMEQGDVEKQVEAQQKMVEIRGHRRPRCREKWLRTIRSQRRRQITLEISCDERRPT